MRRIWIIDIVEILKKEEKKGLLSQKGYLESENNSIDSYTLLDDAEKYKLIFDNASDLIAVVDKKGTFIDLNKKFEEESLYRKQEMLGKNVFTSGIITKKSSLKMFPILQKILKGNPVPIVEVEGVTKKGDIIPYELRAVPLYKHGKVVAAQAILRNITKRKENEKQVRESEHKFRSLVEQAAEMLFLHDMNGNIVDVNKAAMKKTGFSRKELLNMTVYDIDPTAQKQAYKQQYWDELSPKDSPVTVEVFHKRKDDTIYPSEVTFSKVIIQDEAFILALARDITERKESEEALKKSEEKFRLLAENSADCIWMIDKKLRFTYLSPSLERISGFKPEEWIGTKLRPHFKKKEFLKIGFIVAKALKQYKDFKPITFETKMLNKKNEEIDVEITGNVLLDDEGHLKGLQGSTRDISQRKETEIMLSETYRSFQVLFNKMVDPVVIIDGKGTVLEASDKFFDMLAITKEDIIGQNFLKTSFFDGKTKRKLMKNVLFRLAGKHIPPYEINVYRKDGTAIPFEIHAGRVKYNGKFVDMAVFRDLRERKKAEKKLSESEKRYRTVFESTGTAMGIFGDDSVITMVNDEFVRLTGYKKKEIEQKMHWYDFISEKDKKKMLEYHKQRTVNGGDAPKEYDISFVDKKGLMKSVHLNIGIIPGTSTRIASILDVTLLKQTQKKLRSLNKNLEGEVNKRTDKIQDLLKQKDDFINQLGHDLKNPLGPFLQLLPVLKKHVTDKKDTEIIEVLSRNASYMKNLVNKTIELAKLNSSKIVFNFESVNLAEVIQDILSVNYSLFDKHNIMVENCISQDFTVQVDRLRIEEVFTNLFNNAVKYSDGAGKIIVDAAYQDEEVMVKVKDSGIGISDHQMKYLFDEYYKADESRHDFDSSGLGLPICKRIIKKHGGRIWAESEGLGKGSTFYVTLPVSNK